MLGRAVLYSTGFGRLRNTEDFRVTRYTQNLTSYLACRDLGTDRLSQVSSFLMPGGPPLMWHIRGCLLQDGPQPSGTRIVSRHKPLISGRIKISKGRALIFWWCLGLEYQLESWRSREPSFWKRRHNPILYHFEEGNLCVCKISMCSDTLFVPLLSLLGVEFQPHIFVRTFNDKKIPSFFFCFVFFS